jgi:hypothetical protein
MSAVPRAWRRPTDFQLCFWSLKGLRLLMIRSSSERMGYTQADERTPYLNRWL